MSSPPRVLVVDDRPELLLATRRRLASLGWSIDTALDGRAALEAIAENRPDIVVLDVMMPELNGFQVCRRIKEDEATADLPVVLLTGKTSAADRFWGQQAGADAYLTKPVDPAELVRTLSLLLGLQVGD